VDANGPLPPLGRLRGPFGSTLTHMGRPYTVISYLVTERVDDTTWWALRGSYLPWAPEIPVPLAFEESREYHVSFDRENQRWVLKHRIAPRSS
jgi:hypothetical protein